MRAAAAPRFRMPRLGRSPQIVAFILVVGLVGAMGIQPTRRLLDQRVRISSMASELAEVQAGNEHLESQIARLNDPDYLEQRARAFGLVRPGETTYVVMPPSEAEKAKRKRAAPVEPPAPPGFVDSLLHFLGL